MGFPNYAWSDIVSGSDSSMRLVKTSRKGYLNTTALYNQGEWLMAFQAVIAPADPPCKTKIDGCVYCYFIK